MSDRGEYTPSYVSEGDPPSKRAVLSAALRLFVRDGIWETTVRAIAAEAGFSNPVLFKYFRGRDELAAFLFERCYQSYATAVLAAATQKAPFEKRLEAVVRLALRRMDEDLDAFLFVNENLRRLWPALAPAVRRLSVVHALNELFRDAPAARRAAKTEPSLLTSVFVGAVGQLARQHYFGELGPSAEAHAPALLRLFSTVCA